jgi:hypothetical protein
MVCLVLLAMTCAIHGFAAPQEESGQNVPQPPDNPAPTAENSEPPALANVARATVHGVVKDSATGEPLPRALVRIEGDAVTGALTDGEGRFEISGIPIGPQAFQVIKPGFIDPAAAGMGGPPTVINGATNSEHNVYVVPEMPDLAFTLAPTNAIRGQIELSTGDPAQGIAVMLLRRSVQDGRAVWQPLTNVRTNSEGAYRFAGLTDGTYTVFTEPSMDSDIPAPLVEVGSDQAAIRAGYRSVFYPDAQELSEATRIHVAAGEQAQANLLLAEEPFHLVRAVVILPKSGDAPGASPLNVNVTVFDGQSHQLPYSGQYDQATRSAQVFLPDGTYSLQVTAINPPEVVHFGSRVAAIRSDHSGASPHQGQLIGRADFSVAGHAVTHLQIPLVSQRSNLVQVSLVHSTTVQQTANSGPQQAPLVIMLSQAGGLISDGMVTSFGEGYATNPIETSADMGPGSYWVHTSIPQKSLCEASFTAGGASLAREPLVLSLSGASAPLTLTLRDDCASLKISLPPNADVQPTGDEPNYTIYVVPDFDSTTDITPLVLRPSSGGTFALDGLTPGSYHVYTFASPVQLEYRNPEAMAALASHGQPITLEPGGSSSLVVEVPEH